MVKGWYEFNVGGGESDEVADAKIDSIQNLSSFHKIIQSNDNEEDEIRDYLADIFQFI